MIGEEDAPYTYEYESHFKILPAINNWSSCSKRIKTGKPVASGFSYTSDRNPDWMSAAELQQWLAANLHKVGTL